jgi:predicted DNA-binding ribbon-helix-helix protein
MAKQKQPAGPPMKSQNVKRSVEIDGRPTSVSLEDDFWNAFKEIAAAKGTTAQELVLKIDNERTHANLSSAIRLRILSYYRERCDAKR